VKEILEGLYGEMSANLEAEPLEARAKGAQLAFKSLSVERSLGLAQLAHRGQGDEPTALWLQERMQNTGDPLNLAHTQEVGILAAAILSKAWAGKPSEVASVGALAIGAGEFLGWKARVPQLHGSAKTYLAQAALSVRDPEDPELEGTGLADSAEVSFPDDSAHSPERSRELHEELKDLRSELDEAIVLLEEANRAVAEQTSILWWLFGEHLLDGRAWVDVKEAGRPLEFARDLFAITRFIPGPFGAPRFLRRALAQTEMDADRDLTVGGAVREVQESSKVRSATPAPASSPLLMPILCCLHQVEYPAQARPGALHRSAMEIAEQLYRELLIQRALSSDNE
jgi:GTPase-associated system helical domain